MINKMMFRFWAALKDEEGIETLEWIAMGVLIVVLIAAVVYPGDLKDAVTAAIARVASTLSS